MTIDICHIELNIYPNNVLELIKEQSLFECFQIFRETYFEFYLSSSFQIDRYIIAC